MPLRDKSVGNLITGRAAAGVKGARSGCRLSRGTAGTRPWMARETLKRPKPRGKSTDAKAWGGPSHSSAEGSVMESERRGRIR